MPFKKHRLAYLLFFSLLTVSFLRPLLRRADITRRPLGVLIRSRKPCLFFLFRVEGWNVRFILLFYFFKKWMAKVVFNIKKARFLKEGNKINYRTVCYYDF